MNKQRTNQKNNQNQKRNHLTIELSTGQQTNQMSQDRLVDRQQCNDKSSAKNYQEKVIEIESSRSGLIQAQQKDGNKNPIYAKSYTLKDQKQRQTLSKQRRISFNIQNRDTIQNQEGLRKYPKGQRGRKLAYIFQKKNEEQSNDETNDIILKYKARNQYKNSLVQFKDQDIVFSVDQIDQTQDKLAKRNIQSKDKEQLSSDDSSENIFEKMRKQEKNRQNSPSQEDLQESNIFAKYKKISKEKQQVEESSDSDSQNIFERVNKKQEQKTILKNSFQGQSYSLENILQASKLYTNYLEMKKLKTLNSLLIPQLKQTVLTSISKQFFFKPERIEFRRLYDQLPIESIHSSSNFLCKLNKNRDIFYFQDLKEQQPHNLDGFKCSKLLFSSKDKIGKNIEHDHINQRFYIFSNKEQKLLIYSSSSFELLCTVSIKKTVYDPNLHFYYINNRCFLMIIGGYVKIQKSRVTGSNYIQIFELNKWQVILKSKLIKLIIGRINPIILSNQTNLIIIGGNSIAELDKQGKLNYNYEKAINQSTNMTGIIINTQQISELFDYEQQVNVQNISVKINNPHILHSGIVVAYQNSFLLILPNAKNLFYIKLFYKEVNIIETNKVIDFQSKALKNEYQKRELTLKVDRQNLIIYRINSEGILRLIPCQQKKKAFYCNIY